MNMEDELRQKIFEMHGTVKKLDAKLDAVNQQIENLDDELEDVEDSVDMVEAKAQHNRKKIFAITAIGGVASTSLIVVSQLVSTPIS